MAITADGGLWIWGWMPWRSENRIPTPYRLTDNVVDIVAGTRHYMYLTANGNLYAYGNNSNGQLGSGTTHSIREFTHILDDVVHISTGEGHSMAIRSDGSLWGWGQNNYGQLGDGTRTNRLNPVKIMEDVVEVAVGGLHTLAIRSDGTLWGWGSNWYGQLTADGISAHVNPIRLLDDATDTQTDTIRNAQIERIPVSVAAGNQTGFVIGQNGNLFAWGDNSYGQLGFISSKCDSLVSEMAWITGYMDSFVSEMTWVMGEVISVATSGSGHTMVITEDGRLWGWGRNDYGQIGDGTVMDRNAPTYIMSDVAAVAVSSCLLKGTTMAIKTDGSLWGWGNNSEGRLTGGTEIAQRRPVHIMDDVAAVSIGASAVVTLSGRVMRRGTEVLAIRTDGSLWRWGFGQSLPAHIMDNIVAISAGGSHSMAIDTSGVLWGWGGNFHGELGDGTTISSNTPIRIMDDVVAVSAGWSHTAAIQSDGSLWLWGNNAGGQIGSGAQPNRVSRRQYSFGMVLFEYWVFEGTQLSPVRIMGNISSVFSGSGHTIAVDNNGEIWMWGNITSSQWEFLLSPIHITIPSTIPSAPVTQNILLEDNIVVKSGSTYFTAKLDNEGNVWTLREGHKPENALDNVTAIATGCNHIMAIRADSSLWGWGVNASGQLGDGTFTNRETPVWIMDDVVTVAAYLDYTFAITADETLWSWGRKSVLGGTHIEEVVFIRRSPARVLENVADIAHGLSHAVILRTDGTVWTWGDDWLNQLGDGHGIPGTVRRDHRMPTSRPTPMQIMDNVIAISAGQNMSLAIQADGGLWAWGDGVIGDGSGVRHCAPVHIMDNVIAVSTNGHDSYAITADGSLWAWGVNAEGRLGDGSTTARLAPIRVMDNVVAVCTDGPYTRVLKSDGSWWGLGPVN